MIEQVGRTIREQGLAAPGEALWVAVSGGVDSMVLLHVLRKLGHPCHVAHVDHGLRGEASDADRELVRTYCAQHAIPLVVERVDVHERAERTGESTQMAARSLRLAWFNELVIQGPHKMTMAHHADDVTESFFLGLIQGMGARGWGGIQVRSGAIIRPLIGVRREEILAYAAAHGIVWREDASNTDEAYLRNRIRHELLPLLEDWRPGTHRNITRNMRLFGELDVLARAVGEQALAGLVPEAGGVFRVPFQRIIAGTPLLVLHRLLRDKGFHPDRLDDILHAIRQERTGSRFLGEGVEVFVDRAELVIRPEQQVPRSWRFNRWEELSPDAPLRVTPSTCDDIAPAEGSATVWLDAERITFPVELRPWRPGDRMRPDGLGGSKLVSDILTDAKVSRDRKDHIYVLADPERIVWLCGWRLSEGVKATSASTIVLRMDWSGA